MVGTSMMHLQAHAQPKVVVLQANCDEQPAYHIPDADHAQILSLVDLKHQECIA